MKSLRPKLFLFGISFLHGLMMLGVCLWLMSLDFMKGDEAILIRNTLALRRAVLPEGDKPSRDDFLFINSAYSLDLIDKFDPDGIPIGKQAITDRAKLAGFVELLAEQPESFRFLVLDIFFEDESPDDSLLLAALQKLPADKFLTVFHLGEEDDAQYPVFSRDQIPMGLADYREIDGDFLKFKLVRNDTLRSLPLRMYQALHSKSYQQGMMFWQMDSDLAFNSFVVDFRVRPYDLFESEEPYPMQLLEDFNPLWMDGETVRSQVDDRILVVGDFTENDLHETPYGEAPGPLILLNIYLALLAGDNLISPGFLLLLIIAFTGMSSMLFTKGDFLEAWLERKFSKKNNIVRVLLLGLSYLLQFGLLSIICFLLFGVHLNFVLLALYFGWVEWVVGKYRDLQEKRQAKKLEGSSTGEVGAEPDTALGSPADAPPKSPHSEEE